MDGLDLAFYKGRSKYHTKFENDAACGDRREMGNIVYLIVCSPFPFLFQEKTHVRPQFSAGR